jgi:hypothetical protein
MRTILVLYRNLDGCARTSDGSKIAGAGEGIRTLDPNLGKETGHFSPWLLFARQNSLNPYYDKDNLDADRPFHILHQPVDFRPSASPELPRPPPRPPGKQIGK